MSTSKWEEALQHLETEKQQGNNSSPWVDASSSNIWSNLWGGSEKKSDGSDAESQGFLASGFSTAADAFWSTANQAKMSAQEATGE